MILLTAITCISSAVQQGVTTPMQLTFSSKNIVLRYAIGQQCITISVVLILYQLTLLSSITSMYPALYGQDSA